MPTRYTGNVVQALARYLGVNTREIALGHDLYRDWGLTPLSLVIVLLDLERSASIELPCQDFADVRTVAELIAQFRSWMQANVQANEYAPTHLTFRTARSSRSARHERRLRRELHRLRWLEQNLQRRSHGVSRPNDARLASGTRRVTSR